MKEKEDEQDHLNELIETCRIKKEALKKIVTELNKVNVKSKINKL